MTKKSKQQCIMTQQQKLLFRQDYSENDQEKVKQ